MNNVVLIGRIVRDGEYRVTDKGVEVYRFQMAIDRPMKDGEKKTDFPRVIVFGKQATNCNKFLSKGRLVAVQGRIQTGSYQDKDGKTVYTTDVYADRVEFLEWGDKKEKPDDFKAINEDVPF